MTSTTEIPHALSEDIQALLVAPLLVAFALLLFRQAGLLTGVGLLILIRHEASLGGLGVLAIYLHNTRGWPAGKVQMAADCVIVGAALPVRDPLSVGLSVIGALALNLVIAVNHKAGRYVGV